MYKDLSIATKIHFPIIIHDVSKWVFSLANEYKVSDQVVIELVESEGIETIVNFAKKNDIKIIGEFIGRESLYEKIKALNIDYGQGFYMGKPLVDLADDHWK